MSVGFPDASAFVQGNNQAAPEVDLRSPSRRGSMMNPLGMTGTMGATGMTGMTVRLCIGYRVEVRRRATT